MLNLIIDTTTERALLAVLKEGQILFEETLPFGLRSSDYLFPTLEKFLQSFSLVISDFTSIIIAKGPGSYTGIRVGASVAKAFAYAHDLSLFGVSSLHGFAPSEDGHFAVLIDAKVSGVYWIQGFRKGELLEYSTEPAVAKLENLAFLFESVSTVVGPNFQRLRTLIETSYPNLALKWEEINPSAILYAQRAILESLKENFSKKNTQIELAYLRKTQAELEINT